jgi:phosphoribosylaminoimidazolecarboxamide formyltransferase/IMP cyclohydrolase
MKKKINSALISVYHKDNLENIIRLLDNLGIQIYSTGGTFRFIDDLGVKATKVEDLTGYPSIFGGRVKTLHPKVFGGILHVRDDEGHKAEAEKWEIPPIDLVIVDLYPFEETVAATSNEQEIIEKIDIGGISLIRAAAKNFRDVLIVPSKAQYPDLITLLEEKGGFTGLEDRKLFAAHAFNVSSHYDTAIFEYLNPGSIRAFKKSVLPSRGLRYGENPHQEGRVYGELSGVFEQLNGKEISFNNLGDLEAAIQLIQEFEEPAFAILKHNNACGLATRETITESWKDALAGDPVSAFGGVLVTNRTVDADAADEINKLFFETILAPGYEKKSLEILKSKKNRIILQKKRYPVQDKQFKSLLGGIIEQDHDAKTESGHDLQSVTDKKPDNRQVDDLIFANKIVKHTKSNAIVLVKDRQLIGSGTGQTSRVDALKQAIQKAKSFDFDLNGAVMASDAFFPFSDSVEIAHKEGINAVIQPGGSIRDKDSIDYCNRHQMVMVFTGTRHFKH